MRLKEFVGALVVVAVLLLAVGAWLAVDSPSVEVRAGDRLRGPDGTVGCVIAPYDTVLNDADASPGGSDRSSEFTVEVREKCTEANRTRFRLAAGAGVVGLGAMVAAGVVARSLRSSSPRPA